MKRPLACLALAAVLPAFVLPANVAFAAGGGGSTNVTACSQGQVYDSNSESCIDQNSSLVSDEDLTRNAFALADAGRFDEALDMIDRRVSDHDVLSLTARGYTIRKSGEIEASLCYYMDAIAMDGTDTRPRQYLGEAYVQLGRLDEAREQLAAIDARVGADHPHYQALAAMIEAAS